MKRALITGINGQDGSYLAELLLEKGYEVHGVLRSSSFENPARLQNIFGFQKKLNLHRCEIDQQQSVFKVLSEVQPDECYHLAASSFVNYDFDDEAALIATNISSTQYLLSALHKLKPSCRFYFAGSSELFGNAEISPQNEKTAFNPRSAYGISKLASYHLVKNYRERHGMFACTGLTYNHESPRRGLEYVTRKITSGVAKISLGLADSIELGNLSVSRDWGYAPEYVEAMWKMLHNQTPKDYVVATGVSHSLKDFLKIAFQFINADFEKFVRVNSEFHRPAERVPLIGDTSLIRKDLGWAPKKPFEKIIEEMLTQDLATLKSGSEEPRAFSSQA